MRHPNIGLQRTVRLRLAAAEAGALGVRPAGSKIGALAFAAVCVSGCAALPVPSGAALERAEFCRGHVTFERQSRTLVRVAGVVRTINGDSKNPVGNVDIVLRARSGTRVVVIVQSKGNGRFDFGPLPPGLYRLKTCLDGFDTLEMDITIADWGEERTLFLDVPPST